MARVYHILSWVCFATGIGLFALAGYSYFAPPPSFALQPVETEIVVEGVTAGTVHDVPLRFTNRGRQPIRVLGARFC